MRSRSFLAAACAALALQGCASMSEDECLLSDWRTIGYEDGVRGASPNNLGSHRKACAKHGVAVDLDRYREGWKEGMRVFCQPENGFNVGSRGVAYNGACPADLEDEFADAYQAGRHLHGLESEVRSANKRINAKKAALETATEKRKAKEAELIAKETTTSRRVILLSEIKDLSEKQGRLHSEIGELERERAVRERQLESYRASLFQAYH